MRSADRSDTELVLAARNDQGEAFGELFNRWFDSSWNVARNIMRQDDLAADVAQDALLTAWQRLDQLDNPDAFGGWLLRITRNRALNRLEKEQRSRASGDDLVSGLRDQGLPDPTGAERPLGPDAISEVRDRQELLWAASAALGEREASLLDLHLRHGLGPAEIAEELGVEANNAHQQLYRLRTKLGDAIGSYLLWRNGRPLCEGLAAAVSGQVAFDKSVARAVVRHQKTCEHCAERRATLVDPSKLFAAVPMVLVPAQLKAQAAAGLVSAGVPMDSAATGVGQGSGPGDGGGSSGPNAGNGNSTGADSAHGGSSPGAGQNGTSGNAGGGQGGTAGSGSTPGSSGTAGSGSTAGSGGGSLQQGGPILAGDSSKAFAAHSPGPGVSFTAAPEPVMAPSRLNPPSGFKAALADRLDATTPKAFLAGAGVLVSLVVATFLVFGQGDGSTLAAIGSQTDPAGPEATGELSGSEGQSGGQSGEQSQLNPVAPESDSSDQDPPATDPITDDGDNGDDDGTDNSDDDSTTEPPEQTPPTDDPGQPTVPEPEPDPTDDDPNPPTVTVPEPVPPVDDPLPPVEPPEEPPGGPNDDGSTTEPPNEPPGGPNDDPSGNPTEDPTEDPKDDDTIPDPPVLDPPLIVRFDLARASGPLLCLRRDQSPYQVFWFAENTDSVTIRLPNGRRTGEAEGSIRFCGSAGDAVTVTASGPGGPAVSVKGTL